MATEATFTVPSDAFPLGTIFEQLPGVTVELERIIPAQDVVIPYFWVRGTDADDVADAFDDHPGVAEIRSVDAVADQHLLRVEWTLGYEGILSALVETEVPLVEAVGTAEQWTFDVRGDDQQDIAAFQQRCRELEIPITLTQLHALTPLESDNAGALTDAQHEALVLAYRRGYFETPRDATMEDLGAELGISQQAVASRLRGGFETLVGSALPETQSPE